ncbi:Sulf_transp domain-containing protein [Hyphomicrobiales bacterium]|nr:Sulf_transp domain-containing protein [Hyphomicrobiales bacterium]CAH1670374.1 Sulf_transp domain-containing protein [Hyphomicrobiales bacterium]
MLGQSDESALRVNSPLIAPAVSQPSTAEINPSPPAVVVAALIAGALVGAALWIDARADNGPTLALSLILGSAFGFVLQRSRFCFFCAIREWLDERNPSGILAILAALAVGLAGYAVVFGAWLPDPSTGRLAPDAFIGPVGPVLILGGVAFGAGMAISGSCVSAHLYRLGEGSPMAPFALIGTAAGFTLGFLAWNSLYLGSVSAAPIIWLPNHIGYAGTFMGSLAVLALLALALIRHLKARPDPAAEIRPVSSVFVRRWPGWLGGLAVGAIGTVAYLRVAPLGVTAELGGRARQGATAAGLLPERLLGLDTLRGCAALARDVLLTPNGLFVAGMILAALAAALAAGQFRPARPSVSQVLRGLIGGILLGFGAMVALGCSVGTLLSGIMAGALSGWVFAVAMLVGLVVTLRIGRRLNLLPKA